MNAMINCFFSIDTVSSGSIHSFSNSVGMTLQNCDHENLSAELFALSEIIYNKIVEFNNKSGELGLIAEQKELLLNSWCSILQPLFIRMDDQNITEQMLEVFIDLAVNTFQQFNKVMNGGLFILHGLVYSVGERITPYINKFMAYITCSMRMENCDQMGTRMAAGLISDLCNSVQAPMAKWLNELVPLLK